jgi:L-2,4-diaminobutyric acid acetyltransferase
MLDGLVARVAAMYEITAVEATISPDNSVSEMLFTSFARCHDAELSRETLFGRHLFPHTAHEQEVLFRIGPLAVCPD